MFKKQKCIYCFREKPQEEFSLEHIFPDALGGNLCGTTFEINRVCKRCNTLCGLFVDGVFLKSWFAQNYNFESALLYADLEKGSPIPLIYGGILEELSSKTEVCEYWMGPCGEHIYYFHKKDDEYFNSYVKGDPIKRQKQDKGYAIIFGTTKNPFWNKITLLSFKKQFKNAKRYSGNFYLNKEAQQYFFHEPSEDIRRLIENIKKITNKEKKLKVICKEDMDNRFLCKIALGFGFKFLGEEYLNTPYAKELQKALWEPNFSKRKQYKIRGSGFFKSIDNLQLNHFLAWEGGHVILFKITPIGLSVSLFLFGKLSGHVLISDDHKLIKNSFLSNFKEGCLYILIPQRNICHGPIDLLDYLAHRLSGHNKLKELEEIESLKNDLSKLPSCHE